MHVPSGEQTTIFDASRRYLAEGTPLIVLAGKEYGTGSSRDWAAKGPLLLGVRAVIAETYERIHRSNLLMMGILPLQFLAGEGREALGLTGREEFAIRGIENGEATRGDGDRRRPRVPRGRPPGHTARARVPPPRRHPAVRRAPARRLARDARCAHLPSQRRLRDGRALDGRRLARLSGQTGVPRERLRSHPSNLIRVMPAKGGNRS